MINITYFLSEDIFIFAKIVQGMAIFHVTSSPHPNQVSPDSYRLYLMMKYDYLTFSPRVFYSAGNNFSKVLHSFSLKRNIRQLLSVNASPEDIRSVHGIRALNALMLLVSHKSMAMFFNPYSNRTTMTEVK